MSKRSNVSYRVFDMFFCVFFYVMYGHIAMSIHSVLFDMSLYIYNKTQGYCIHFLFIV